MVIGVAGYDMNDMSILTPGATDMQSRVLYSICKLEPVVSRALDTTAQIHWFSHSGVW